MPLQTHPGRQARSKLGGRFLREGDRDKPGVWLPAKQLFTFFDERTRLSGSRPRRDGAALAPGFYDAALLRGPFLPRGLCFGHPSLTIEG